MNTSPTTVAPGVTVRDRKGGDLLNAHHQWCNRPADERFLTLEAFHAAMAAHRKASLTSKTTADKLRPIARDGEVMLVGEAGVPALLTNYAFGQFSAKVGAPASYLRTLPAETAATCLGHGLDRLDSSGVSLLLRREDAAFRMHAITSDKYARVWNQEIAASVLAFQATHPTWQNPEAFRTATGTKAGAWGTQSVLPCAFGGDRDCFVFLVDYTKTVKVPGQDHPLARGFFLENSEVGDASIKLTMFLFDFVCSNMIVWNTSNVKEVNIRHVGKARDRLLTETVSGSNPGAALSAFANASTRDDEARIVKLMASRFGDNMEDTIDVIAKRKIPLLTASSVSAAIEIANQNPRYGDPLSAWGIVNGLTEYSQRTSFAGDRVAMDRATAQLLKGF